MVRYPHLHAVGLGNANGDERGAFMEGESCTCCRRRPAARHGRAAEFGRCHTCQATYDESERQERAKRERQRAFNRALTAAIEPPAPHIPRYITWRGHVIGLAAFEELPEADKYSCTWRRFDKRYWQLPKRGTVNLDRWCQGLTRDQVKRYKALVSRIVAHNLGKGARPWQGKIPDLRPVVKADYEAWTGKKAPVGA